MGLSRVLTVKRHTGIIRFMSDDERFSLTELADLGRVTPRTVRYYLAQGLLPAVGLSGPGSKYDPAHLARLRLIRRLQAEHLPLAEIRRRLEGLDETEIRDLAGSGDPAPPTDSALDYLRTLLDGPEGHRTLAVQRPTAPARFPAVAMPVAGVADAVVERYDQPGSAPVERSQWERIALAPDVELHVRRPLARAQQKGVDRLVTITRELLEEDRP
jgi:DNA-binding transcriptional MerR regulator